MAEFLERVNILGTLIDNLSMREFLGHLDHGVVFTPNVDHLIRLLKDEEFRRAYNVADYRLCDSQVLMYAAQFLGTPFKEKLSGSDIFPSFYRYHRNNEAVCIFLLGAAEGVVQQAQVKINARVDREIIVAAHSPSFGFENNEPECLDIIDRINRSDATVLAMGVGTPQQEKWIVKYKDCLPTIKIFMAIGATIDFEAGFKPRAPQWMSRLGVEWLYRLVLEPRRLWKRYLVESLPQNQQGSLKSALLMLNLMTESVISRGLFLL